MTLVSLLRF